MTIVDELRAEAEDAITEMRAAALTARRTHARAELLRHMQSTGAKVKDLPLDEAVVAVTDEWMRAWRLEEQAYPEVATEMRGFTAACCALARAPGADTDAALRAALAALDEALVRAGMTLADQMAWRSECAHDWWALVAPAPAGIVKDGRERQPFWEAGCPPHCR
ncbi:MAG: hypothetical protein WD969_13930 [Paracoccaceae bacterium]